MPKSLKVKVGNKAKSRRSYHHKETGKYTRQALRTIENRKRKQMKHLRKVEKKAQKGLFILPKKGIDKMLVVCYD